MSRNREVPPAARGSRRGCNRAVVTSFVCGLVLIGCGRGLVGDVEWPVYQGPGSNQFSPLDQINRDNVTDLQVAWSYNTGDATERSQIQCNPIVVDAVLYCTSAALRAFALDAATGGLMWTFDPVEHDPELQQLSGANRGVTFWSDGQERRILYAAGSKLYALDAETGDAIESFGSGGAVDLRAGLGAAGGMTVGSTSPPALWEDLVVVPTRVAEQSPAAPGHVRAYDVRTGAVVWTFHTIPRPGELGYETWPADAWQSAGGANNWAGMTVDQERGVVFVPTGSAASDFHGGTRVGDNLFANTLLALDAATGDRIWHYQIVRHDLWDRDLPAPPNLITVRRDGRDVEAVAQITKSAHVWVFDRDTGEPLFPVEEISVPASDLYGEVASPTQRLPTLPPPFARQAFTPDEVTDLSPEAAGFVRDRLERARSGGQFVPPSREGTVMLPGFDGGGEWGGAAADAERGMLYVNASEMPWILTMVAWLEELGAEADDGANRARRVYADACLHCHGLDGTGDPQGEFPALSGIDQRRTRSEVTSVIRTGRGRMPPFGRLSDEVLEQLVDYLFDSDQMAIDAALLSRSGGAASEIAPVDPDELRLRFTSTGYNRFLDIDGYPAIRPPWGTLTALDLNVGRIVWQVPLGEFEELTARGIPPTGTENYGGPVVTAGGLVFIGATQDEKFRAFDRDTGELLWETDLPAGGYATPSTYSVDGRQFVVIAAGGGKMGTASGDTFVAFALPGR